MYFSLKSEITVLSFFLQLELEAYLLIFYIFLFKVFIFQCFLLLNSLAIASFWMRLMLKVLFSSFLCFWTLIPHLQFFVPKKSSFLLIFIFSQSVNSLKAILCILTSSMLIIPFMALSFNSKIMINHDAPFQHLEKSNCYRFLIFWFSESSSISMSLAKDLELYVMIYLLQLLWLSRGSQHQIW